MDVWGAIYLDYWKGERRPHVVERDDGVAMTLDSPAVYFEAPRSEGERRLLDVLEGPVLDLGCGPGSYALYLQARGLAVTAADFSPGAIRVCRERGCLDARVLDVRDLHLPDAAYGSIIVMGNTLGLHQDPTSLPRFLEALRRATRSSGRLLCATRDPLETSDPVHLAYHQRNRDRGLPAGMTRIRMTYREETEDWVTLWLMTAEELGTAIEKSGWMLRERESVGPLRVDLYESTSPGRSERSFPG